MLRPALFRGEVVPFGWLNLWELFGTPAALESHLFGVLVYFGPEFGRLGGDNLDSDACVDTLDVLGCAKPRLDIEKPLETHIDNLGLRGSQSWGHHKLVNYQHEWQEISVDQ